MLSLAAFSLSLLSLVHAHGFVSGVGIDGTDFDGAEPNSGRTDGVIRVVSSIDPNYGASNPALNCGPDASAVSGLARGNPGDTMAFHWSFGSWPHNTGPMITYMAACTNGDCTTFDSTQADWFKIGQQGFEGGQWVQQRVMNGEPATATIPDNLAAGQYLVRHEIIALHLADSVGPEYYPACIQLEVGGAQTGVPAAGEAVRFPGGYADGDPGLAVNAFSEEGTVGYQFPGPGITSLAAEGEAPAPVPSPGPEADDVPEPEASPEVPPPGTGDDEAPPPIEAPGSSCRLKKVTKRSTFQRSKAVAHKKRADPHHMSRVMRGLSVPVSS